MRKPLLPDNQLTFEFESATKRSAPSEIRGNVVSFVDRKVKAQALEDKKALTLILKSIRHLDLGRLDLCE